MAIVINPISPVAFDVFGFGVRWYALAYVLAFVIGFYLIKYLSSKPTSVTKLSKKQLDDLFTYLILGVILGGRLGYVLFYNLPYFINNPLEIFAIWHGGMSFHGGLLGVIVGVFLFTKKIKTGFQTLDLLTVVAPIGLFFGRIANFINMELMGRPTNSPFGIIFNGQTQTPCHPSPLYEALSEGILLFLLMFILYHKTNLRKKAGCLSGLFAIFYGLARIFCEQFRTPDIQIGFLTSWGLTMGQLLSSIMIIAGSIIFAVAFRKK